MKMARKEVDFFSAGVLGAVAAVEEAQCPIFRGLTADELKVSHGRSGYDGTASEQGTAGVRIQVVSGFVRPEAGRIAACEDAYKAEWTTMLAKKFSIRPTAADAHIAQARRVRDLPPATNPPHRHGPPSCRIDRAGFSPQFRDFIGLCLRKDAAQRPTAHALLSHGFIRLHDDALRPFDMASFVKGVTQMRDILS